MFQQRQFYPEFGPLSEGALEIDSTRMFLDNAPGDRKSETGAFRFGGEERFKKPIHNFRSNAAACIGYDNTKSGSIFRARRSGESLSGDPQFSTRSHGGERIEE